MANIHGFTPSKAPVKRVSAVQLSVWDPEEIVSEGACARARLHGAASAHPSPAGVWQGPAGWGAPPPLRQHSRCQRAA